jgi:DNA-binding MarR family transcriptional regulator
MPSQEPSQEALGAALDHVLELTVLLNDDMTRSLAEQGLTASRTHLLWELARRGPTTQRVLAEALDVSPRNITGLVDALVTTGFVTRKPHPTDRRATLVSFTDRGAATARWLQDGHRELADILFADLPGEQLDCFVSALAAVLGRLRERLLAESREPADA